MDILSLSELLRQNLEITELWLTEETLVALALVVALGPALALDQEALARLQLFAPLAAHPRLHVFEARDRLARFVVRHV